MPDLSHAPWSNEQLQSIKEFQNRRDMPRLFHRAHGDGDGLLLTGSRDYLSCVRCGHRQDWVPAPVADGSWRNSARREPRAHSYVVGGLPHDPTPEQLALIESGEWRVRQPDGSSKTLRELQAEHEMNIADFVTRRMNDAFRDERETVHIHETESVRSPGWYRAHCFLHEWETEGSGPVVEEARDEHITREHLVGQLIHGVHATVTLYRAELREKAERDARDGVFPGHDHVHRGRLAALEEALRAFAAPYVEHPDHRPEWRIDV